MIVSIGPRISHKDGDDLANQVVSNLVGGDISVDDGLLVICSAAGILVNRMMDEVSEYGAREIVRDTVLEGLSSCVLDAQKREAGRGKT